MRFLFIILLFPFFGQAQTRLYFPEATASFINPSFDAAWDATGSAVRRQLAHSKGSSTLADGSAVTSTSGQDALHRQYVSFPMNSGITFTSGSTGIKCYIMAQESAANDNATNDIGVRILSNDGATVRATLISVGTTNAGEFNTTNRNKMFIISGATSISSYTTVSGDRIVVEVGHIASGTSISATIRFGENATDLPENETQTTDGAGWIEFSNTITFTAETGPTRRVTIIQ